MGIYRLKKSKDFPNPASNLEGKEIAIFDSAFDKTRNFTRILTHEISHQRYRELSVKEKRDYGRALGWRFLSDSPNLYYWGRRGEFVEEDGKNSTEEDFANNLEYFLHDPDRLKKTTPEAYSWLKKHFGADFQLKKVKK